MHCAEAAVVAGIDRDDALRMGVELLDVDAGAEAATFGAQHDHARGRIAAEPFDLVGKRMPAGVVERIDRRPVDDEFGDAVGNGGGEAVVHMSKPGRAQGRSYNSPCRNAPWARQFACTAARSEEHTSELQSLMRISYAVFCLKKKK